VIGDPANPIGTVKVCTLKGDRVRLAFDFPTDIAIHRREVADAIIAVNPVGEIRPSA
jgi:carbon storage regulator CsrA